MNYLSLKEIQDEEKELLKVLIDFLDKNHIPYFMIGGTFLGAVRHKGFIPWDDDIDIAIYRDDYERLITIVKELSTSLTNNIEFVGYELGNGKYPFIKLINKNISLEQNVNVDKYLWIDIFPIDKVPEDEEIYRKFAKKAFIKHEFISLKLMKYKDVFKSSKTLPRRILKIVLRPFLCFMNLDKYTSNYIKFCKQFSSIETSDVAEVAWNLSNEKKFKKAIINNLTKYKFEDIEVSGIKEYDTFLSLVFGDYMQLPPENKRYTHSFNAYKNN